MTLCLTFDNAGEEHIDRILKVCTNRWPSSEVVLVSKNSEIVNDAMDCDAIDMPMNEYIHVLCEKYNPDRLVLIRSKKIEDRYLSDVFIPIYRDILLGYGGLKLLNSVLPEDDYRYWDANFFNKISKDVPFKEPGRFEYFPYFAMHRWNGHGDINDLCFRVKNYEALKKEKRGNKKLVVILGNSASFDPFCGYEESMAGVLDKRLGDDYIVANFSMPFATVLDEINIYNILVARLEPDVVISHSFFTDITSSINGCPSLVDRYGIFYSDWCEDVAQKIYLSNKHEKKQVYDFNSMQKICATILEHHKRLQKIVEFDDAIFIQSLQPILLSKRDLGSEERFLVSDINKRYPHKDIAQLLYLSLFDYLSRVAKREFHNFIDFHRLFESFKTQNLFADEVHTLPRSSCIFADCYTNIVLRNNYPTTMNDPISTDGALFAKCKSIISAYEKIVIYGFGVYGKIILDLFQFLGISVVVADDNKCNNKEFSLSIESIDCACSDNCRKLIIVCVYDDIARNDMKKRAVPLIHEESTVIDYYDLFL